MVQSVATLRDRRFPLHFLAASKAIDVTPCSRFIDEHNPSRQDKFVWSAQVTVDQDFCISAANCGHLPISPIHRRGVDSGPSSLDASAAMHYQSSVAEIMQN
ncbi:MAG: hypothetical protein DMF03_14025 [Verrucomicrobia bacterium]|nr:MAG: hypothetical protein DMF03_14025 [Verrucomicrobiota bacterium]